MNWQILVFKISPVSQAWVRKRSISWYKIWLNRTETGIIWDLLEVNSFQLEKFENIVREREDYDDRNVTKSLIHSTLQCNDESYIISGWWYNDISYLTQFALKGLQMLKYLSTATATTLYTLPVMAIWVRGRMTGVVMGSTVTYQDHRLGRLYSEITPDWKMLWEILSL